ncbi:MAG: RNA polymerase subunit sigma-70 [bacterium]|nr:RNA polymerase subunit sigma-70 [bacterium]
MTEAEEPITLLLNRMCAGDPGAESDLATAVHEALRDIARRHMDRERADHTLQPSALVSEFYLRLRAMKTYGFENRRQFYSLVAGVMRRILVDYARRRSSEKRGGALQRVAFDALDDPEAKNVSPDAVSLYGALDELRSLDSIKADVFEMSFVSGLSNAEIAEVLEIGTRDAERARTLARAWMGERLRA